MLQVHFETKGGWLIFLLDFQQFETRQWPIAILCDPSETVMWAFRRLSDLQLQGIKRSQLESPGNGKLVSFGQLVLWDWNSSVFCKNPPGVSQNIPRKSRVHPPVPKRHCPVSVSLTPLGATGSQHRQPTALWTALKGGLDWQFQLYGRVAWWHQLGPISVGKVWNSGTSNQTKLDGNDVLMNVDDM